MAELGSSFDQKNIKDIRWEIIAEVEGAERGFSYHELYDTLLCSLYAPFRAAMFPLQD